MKAHAVVAGEIKALKESSQTQMEELRELVLQSVLESRTALVVGERDRQSEQAEAETRPMSQPDNKPTEPKIVEEPKIAEETLVVPPRGTIDTGALDLLSDDVAMVVPRELGELQLPGEVKTLPPPPKPLTEKQRKVLARQRVPNPNGGPDNVRTNW